MSEKELINEIKNIILTAEQNAMKEELNANEQKKNEIKAKTEGVMNLCRLLRETLDKYDNANAVPEKAS